MLFNTLLATGADIAEAEEGLLSIFKRQSFGGVVARMGLTIFITILLAQTVRYIWVKRSSKKDMKIHQKFFYNAIVILIYVIGAMVAIGQSPQGDSILNKLLAGSGVAALAVSLAAQESLGNIVNGIVLTISKPFEVGDRIHLVNGNITGYVEDITLRHTVMRTFINSRIIIPNSTINKDMIENSNYEVERASSFIDVIITFDSDMDKAMKIMADIIGSHPRYLDTRTPSEMSQPKVKVFVRDLSLNGIMLRASMWTATVDENFEACSDARYKIKKAFDEKGILLAQLPARPTEYARAGAIPSESGNYPGRRKFSAKQVPDES